MRAPWSLATVAVALVTVGASPVLVTAAHAAPPAARRSGIESTAVRHDTSPPLREMAKGASANRVVSSGGLPAKRLPTRPTPTSTASVVSAEPTPAVGAGPLAPFILSSSEGVGEGFTGPAGTFTVTSAPPDTTGDVGPSHYVQMVNAAIAIFNKAGAPVLGPLSTNTVWSGFGGGCQTNNDGDGSVRYDPIADRWTISQFSVSTTPYLECFAVSTTGDPTGSYHRYAFSYGNVDFPDYPKVAAWPDAYYVTFNIFPNGTTFSGARACAYDRAKMLAGLPATQQCFDTGSAIGGLLASDLDGSTLPPAGAPNVMAALGATANDLAFYKLHVDWVTAANSTFTGPIDLAVPPFTEACGTTGTCIPQSGTTQTLDSLSDRLMDRLAYRNFGDHQSLVANHSVTVGAATGVRWYEVRLDGTQTPSVFQVGTYAPDANHRWMGSIAMDRQGNMALGFSRSSSSIHPQIHVTGRLAGDAFGAMTQGEASIIDGSGSQTTGLNRWGDYSNMNVDPVDDCTFWYTNEYLTTSGNFNWHTRIGSFKLPGCAVPADFSISASPSSVSAQQGTVATSTISTAVTAGAAGAVSLGVTGTPIGATASLSPSTVSAGGASTLTLGAGTAAAGTYTVTVTGVEGTATHSTTVSFTVTPGPGLANGGFESGLTGWASTGTTASTAVHRSGLLGAQVGSTGPGANSTLKQTFTPSAGATRLSLWYQMVCLDTVAHDWAQVTLKDNSVGTSSALLAKTCTNNGTWVQLVRNVIAGHSYTLTLLNHDDKVVGNPTYTVFDDVTVAAPTLLDGDFESGLLGWTTAGSAANTGVAHAGSSSVMVGLGTPTRNSSVAQTFVAPAGTTQLSFWFESVCLDTVAHDWASATLRDGTTATTTTVLAKTCTNNGTWVKVISPVVAGHSYTLTLANHDDNNSADPTYTLYDDVTLT